MIFYRFFFVFLQYFFVLQFRRRTRLSAFS